MSPEVWISALTFVAISGLALPVLKLLARGDPRLVKRLQGLPAASGDLAVDKSGRGKKVSRLMSAAVPKLSARLLPGNEADRTRLQHRLLQAGIYSPSALSVYLSVKLALMSIPAAASVVVAGLGLVSAPTALLAGGIAGGVGMVLPSTWLDWKRSRRQSTLRRALPDFLDLMVACVEAGLSLQAALQRVTDELRIAHPLLAAELRVVNREVELGGTMDEALRHFADRSGVDSVRGLSTFVQQARRYGATIAEAMRLHADTLRQQREQRAEEMAHKAAVKILFPTLLLIFPAVFVVLAGPAAIQLRQKLSRNAELGSKNR